MGKNIQSKYAELQNLLGDRMTFDEFERTCYSRDLAPMPSIMGLLYRATPDAVVRPINASEVSSILKFANKHGTPVTPRGAATSALSGAVPTRGGIVLDMSSMNKKIELNEKESTVTVDAGVVWNDLEKYLNNKGFSLMSHPSSAPSATIGGWLSSPGLGIGTLRYGPVHSQVSNALVVLPNGEICRLFRDSKDKGIVQPGRGKPGLDWFFGAEGTCGVIAEAELEVRKKPDKTSRHLIAYDHLKEFCDALQEISKLKPFYLSYSDSRYRALMEEAGYKTPTKAEYVISANFEGGLEEVAESVSRLERIIKDTGGLELSKHAAEEEWEERFKPMRFKKNGPTLLAGDVMVPSSMLHTALEAMYTELGSKKLSFGIEGSIPSEGVAIVMPMYLSDERKPLKFIFALRHISRINNIAISVGGKPYGVGLWNSPYINSVMSKRLRRIKRKRRKRLDPRGLLNPDKHLGVRSPALLLMLNPSLYGMSMSMMELTSKPIEWALNQVEEYL